MRKKYFSVASSLALVLLLTGAGCNNKLNISSNIKTDDSNLQTEQTATSQTQVENEDKEKKEPENKNETKTGNTTSVKGVVSVEKETPGGTIVDINIKTPAAATVKEFTITAKNWEFSPSAITVNKGDKVRLKITSTDGIHSFVLADFNVSSKLEVDNTQVIEFTADKAGSFKFRCGIPCGSGHMDMNGTLIVK